MKLWNYFSKKYHNMLSILPPHDYHLMQRKILNDQWHNRGKNYDGAHHWWSLNHPCVLFPREKQDQADAYLTTLLDEDSYQMLWGDSILSQFPESHVLHDDLKFVVLFHLHVWETLCHIQALFKKNTIKAIDYGCACKYLKIPFWPFL